MDIESKAYELSKLNEKLKEAEYNEDELLLAAYLKLISSKEYAYCAEVLSILNEFWNQGEPIYYGVWPFFGSRWTLGEDGVRLDTYYLYVRKDQKEIRKFMRKVFPKILKYCMSKHKYVINKLSNRLKEITYE